MVEANAVERVEQGEATLDLMRFDHALENIFDGDAFVLACQVVRDGEDGTEIVGRVAPCDDDTVVISVGVRTRETGGNTRTFCGEEAIVKVQPADDGPNVKRSADRVKLVVGPWDLGSWMRRMSGADLAAKWDTQWIWGDGLTVGDNGAFDDGAE
jgi:hypothetical protein